MSAANDSAAAAAVPVSTALVLAGGRGTRLQPVVGDRPKPLAQVGDRPFLSRLLDQLAAAGIERTVLCVGYLADQVERACGSQHDGMQLVYSREAAPLGTAGALRHALPMVEGDHVLVLNGDSYCDLELQQFACWAAARHRAALVAVRVPDVARYGVVIQGRALEGGGRLVAGFREKDFRSGPGLVNAGVYCLHRGVLEALPAGVPLALERDVLPDLLASGLAAWPSSAPFLDIGTPESYAAADAFFATVARRHAGGRRGLVVLDRDGTLIAERHYLADPTGVELLPGAVEGLRALQQHGYTLAVVTNQSGIGRGYFDTAALHAVHDELRAQLEGEGIAIAGIWHCPHHPDDGCSCRKPAPGLLHEVLDRLGFAPAQCLVVGDKECDIELGRAVGARTALVRTGYGAATERSTGCRPDLVVAGLDELAAAEVAR